jgi:hypothetical protein
VNPSCRQRQACEFPTESIPPFVQLIRGKFERAHSIHQGTLSLLKFWVLCKPTNRDAAQDHLFNNDSITFAQGIPQNIWQLMIQKAMQETTRDIVVPVIQ